MPPPSRDAERHGAKQALAAAIDAAGVAAGAPIAADGAARRRRSPRRSIASRARQPPRSCCSRPTTSPARPSPLNLPGTDRERPNWRRKVRVDVAALWQTPSARRRSPISRRCARRRAAPEATPRPGSAPTASAQVVRPAGPSISGTISVIPRSVTRKRRRSSSGSTPTVQSLRQPAVLVDDHPPQHACCDRRRRWAGPPNPRSCRSRARGRSRTAATGARSSR